MKLHKTVTFFFLLEYDGSCLYPFFLSDNKFYTTCLSTHDTYYFNKTYNHENTFTASKSIYSYKIFQISRRSKIKHLLCIACTGIYAYYINTSYRRRLIYLVTTIQELKGSVFGWISTYDTDTHRLWLVI